MHIGVHGFDYALAVGHRFHNGARAAGGITRGKDAGATGFAVLIGSEQAAAYGINAFCCGNQVAFRTLTDGNDNACARIQLFTAGDGGDAASLLSVLLSIL